ncbi:MAG TPA: hypothetical protein VJ894_03100 [Cryomorphaceae bacterium]|nr:hypothetical protein [Cryomorphaceae bacterium]
MKTTATFLFTLFFTFGMAQNQDSVAVDNWPEVDLKLFKIHLPLILDNVKVSEKIASDGHDGGMAYYVNVGDYKELGTREPVFTRGVHTYAMTTEQLERRYVENFLRLDNIENKGETTEYNFFSHTENGQEIGVAATILNNTDKDTGPQLAEIHVLDMDEDFEKK